MEPISLIDNPPTVVVESKPVSEADRALLVSILEPTRSRSQVERPPSPGAEDVSVGAGIVLSVPFANPTPGYTTPAHGPTRYIPVTPPSSLKRAWEESDDAEPSPPACCTSLTSGNLDH